MGMEVRMVPKEWEHPKDEAENYIPLRDGAVFQKHLDNWKEGLKHWQKGKVRDYSSDKKKWKPKGEEHSQKRYSEWAGDRPVSSDYMPQFSPEEATHYQLYHTVKLGIPLSPPMETKELLAQWMVDNRILSNIEQNADTHLSQAEIDVFQDDLKQLMIENRISRPNDVTHAEYMEFIDANTNLPPPSTGITPSGPPKKGSGPKGKRGK